jgi:hypothetical protein
MPIYRASVHSQDGPRPAHSALMRMGNRGSRTERRGLQGVKLRGKVLGVSADRFEARRRVRGTGDLRRGLREPRRQGEFLGWRQVALIPFFQESLGEPSHIRDFRVERECIDNVRENEREQCGRVIAIGHPKCIFHERGLSYHTKRSYPLVPNA